MPTGVAPPQSQLPGGTPSPTSGAYAGMTPDQIYAAMSKNGYTQEGVDAIYAARNMGPAPQLPPGMVGARLRPNDHHPNLVGVDGKPLPSSVAAAAADFRNNFVSTAVDPYRQRSGVSNFAGGLLNAVGTYVGGPVWTAMTAVADAGNKALGNNDGTSYTDGRRSGADHAGAAIGSIGNMLNGPGSYGANNPAPPTSGPKGGIPGIAGPVASGGAAAGSSSGSGNILSSIFGNGTGTMGSESGFDWGQLLSTLSSAAGAYESSQGANQSQQQIKDALGRISTTLPGSAVAGPGGVGGAILPGGAGGSYSLGGLDSLNALFAQLANSSATAANGANGLPSNVSSAAQGVQNASGLNSAPDTNYLTDGANSVFARALQDMNRGSVAPGLAAQSFAGAGQQLADAGRGFNDVRDQTLQTLRAQAQPFEDRAYDKLQNDQFSRGQMGSSGGALQTEAFARGLGQADTDRQLQANQEARTTQQNALGIGQGLAQTGAGVTGLDDQLLQSAFGRFGSTAGLASDLSQQRFGNSTLLNNTGFDRAQTNLGNQINLAQLPTALQGSNLGLALQALQGSGALQNQGLAQFQAALAAASAGANAKNGNANAVASLTGLGAQMPNSNDIWGQILSGIGNRTNTNTSGSGGLAGLFGGLFGGGGNNGGTRTTQPTNGDFGW